MKRKKKRFFKQNKLALLLLLGFLAYVSITLLSQELKARELRTEELQLKQQIAALSSEIEGLESHVDTATSLEQIEKLAREKLKMIKADEIIYFIAPQTDENAE